MTFFTHLLSQAQIVSDNSHVEDDELTDSKILELKHYIFYGTGDKDNAVETFN